MVIEDEVGAGFLAFPILLVVVAFGGVASFAWSLHEGAKYTEALGDKELTEEERQQISSFSMKNLVSEAIFFICMVISLCAWMIMYRLYCDKCNQSQCLILQKECVKWFAVNQPVEEIVESCDSVEDLCDQCDVLNNITMLNGTWA